MASFQQSLIDALQLDNFPKLKSFVESTEMAPMEDVVGAADIPMPKTIDNKTIQNNLNTFLSRKGSKKRLTVDGIIGTDTTSVIKDFQKAQGLEADGIVGSKTIAALYSLPSIGENAVDVKTLEPAQVSDAPIEPPVSKGIMSKQEPIKEVAPVVMPEELSVEQIQGYLTIEGFDVGGVDGKMGPKTRRAIREFQKSRGLKADGIVGKNTIAALLSEPKEDPLADKRPKARPSLMSPDEEEEFDASQSVSREGQISGEGALDQFASSSTPLTMQRVNDFRKVLGTAEGQAKALMSAAPLAAKILPINAGKFAEFLANEGQIELTSKDLGRDYLFLRDKAKEVIDRGDSQFTYSDWGFEDGKSALVADITKTAWNSISDPSFRMATLIGQTAEGNVRVEDGRIIVEDVYDFNTGPRGVKMQKALKAKEAGDNSTYERLSSEALKDMTHLGQLRVWAAALGVPQGEGTRFKLDLGPAT